MTIIQLTLTVCLILIGIYMYTRLRSTLLDVILILLATGTGIFFVLFPDFTTQLAHWMGVGRGVDLLLYLGFLFLFFLIIKLYARIRKMEHNFTEVVRNKSIKDAENLEKKN
ncbi:MAG TPA: DUF2304 domain-containing protein [Chitinophagaceae bacterium]|nr:DUF2304 domain-containing protein [Chitinophagaceae bacterium]